MSMRLYPSPLGAITIAASQGAITGLWFEEEPYTHIKAASMPYKSEDSRVLREAEDWLTAYFFGKNPPMDLKLNARGSEFQKAVWNELLSIPYGQTVTYSQIAQKLDTAPMAVAGALASNPILIMLPCHRVVSVSKKGSGYSGGMKRKEALLRREQKNAE